MDAAAVADPNHRSIHVTLDQQGGDAAQSTAVAPWEAAQRRMNHFVRTVALLERAGNGLGTLAFTWATVVILGGFSTNLGPDFWYATTIVFLEAFRVFSRESRSDDELLFKTTGSIRLKRVILISNVPYYLNVGIVMVSLYGTIEFLLIHYNYLIRPPHQMQFHFLLLAALLALASMVQLPTIVKYMKGHKLLQSSPLVAVLAFGGVLLWTNAPPRFAALVVAPLFVGCLQNSVIAACLQKTKILSNLPIWIQKMGTFIFPVWIAISVPIAFGCMGILVLLGTLLVGNIQVPVALARIGLSSMRLSSDNSHNDENSEHLAPALKIFYSMVLGQGTLYILACICESLLFRRLRRSLAQTLKVLEYKEAFHSIDLYYEHAYDKCMEDGVLAREDLNLVRFAVDSLESNSRARKLAAVQILHSLLLGQEASNTLHVSEITTSTKAVATLISMLGWTGAEDQDIRFFAAKITVKLAGDLLIVGIPGTIQMISSLLDSGEKHYLVKQGISAQIMDINEQYNDNLQLISHGSAARVDIKGVEAGYQIRAIQAISDHAVSNSEWRSKIFKFLQHIKNMLSIPREGKEPWTDDNSFPVQGMLILEKLTHDLDNCAEINRATGLIPKIVRFINYTTETTNISEQQQNLIMAASLKLVARLASIEGEIGIALRWKILEQPFLLSNLVEILEDSNGSPEQWGAALVIIAKLAVNVETRQKIGDSKVIIPKLMQTFLCRDGSSNMYFDHVVRMVAGEALSTLTKENTSYCSALLEETKYDVIEGLKNMLKEDEYAYVAASMLWNMCTYSRDNLFHLGLSIRLLATLPVVLEKLIDTKGNKQLEALLVLTSQLYNLNPEQFANELESHKDAKRLVQKVVGKLNSCQKPHPEYPMMRRALVEVAISIVESCPCYSTIFREVGMMEALSKVEIASLKVEKYKVFLGNASGVVVESGLHLPDLIDKAKRLIGSTTPTSTTLKPGSRA